MFESGASATTSREAVLEPQDNCLSAYLDLDCNVQYLSGQCSRLGQSFWRYEGQCFSKLLCDADAEHFREVMAYTQTRNLSLQVVLSLRGKRGDPVPVLAEIYPIRDVITADITGMHLSMRPWTPSSQAKPLAEIGGGSSAA